jgi:hypothetical protein
MSSKSQLSDIIGRRVLEHGGGDVYQTSDSAPLLADVEVVAVYFGYLHCTSIYLFAAIPSCLLRSC